MSRPLRLEYPGAIWHVTSRGNERKAIFADDDDREKFLEILGQAVVWADWRLHAYVLMGNHYHLLVETPEPTLSRGMRQLNGVYTQHYNRRHKRSGHLFQGRFKGILTEKESHLSELIRYVVLNPVRAKLCANAKDWRWSSYRATAGMTKNYSERLPKAVRVRTAMMASARSKGSQHAAEIGLTALLRSDSFHALAEALSGHRLRSRRGTQILCYQARDYTGPHNDHHPEGPDAKGGYVDLHLGFANAAVDHQWLVYEHEGHLTQVQSVALIGGVACYRLPLWHYTTPLAPRLGQVEEARRWVLLGTFLDRRQRGVPSVASASEVLPIDGRRARVTKSARPESERGSP